MQPLTQRLLLLLLSTVLVVLSIVVMMPVAIASSNWGYDGNLDPSHWASLQSDFALCGTGQSQSPIDLSIKKTVENTDTLKIDYHATPLHEVNTGLTLQMNYAQGSTITMDDQVYELVQFHFHTPSEHLIDHKPQAMELHLVHKNAADQLAVIAVMVEPGQRNLALDEIWDYTPAPLTETQIAEVRVDASQLLPRDRSFYHYQGSLTTPPCSESVNWAVMKDPIQASPQQIKTFKTQFHANARPIQDLHNRTISFSP